MEKFDYKSQAFKRAPHATLARMVAAGPFVPMKFPFFGEIQFATTYDAAQGMLKETDRFAVDARNAGKKTQVGISWAPKSFKALAQNMLTSDEPAHRRLRKLSDAPFRAMEIDKMRPAIERLADELIDQMDAEGEVDLVNGFCRVLPLLVICEMLGLPRSDQPKFVRWMDDFSNAGSLTGIFRVMPTVNKMTSYLREQAERRRADTQPGLITELVQAEADGESMSADELTATLLLLFVAGHETTTHLISSGVVTLLEQRNALEDLKSDWTLAPSTVEEMLRYNSPVQMTKPRYARQDMDFQGVTLKRGDRLMAYLAAANMDPAHFERPEAFDIRREKNRHLGFGGGPHLCLGLHLARAEAQIGFERLFTRWPDLEIDGSVEDLRWVKHPGMRGLKTLPVRRAVRALPKAA